MANSLCILWVVLVPALCSFNLDLRYPNIYESAVRGDYFGFSVALHPRNRNPAIQDEAWLMVGAPRRNRTNSTAYNPGQAFICPLTGPCMPLRLDQESKVMSEKVDGSMTGAAIDANSDHYVVGAPRWKYESSSKQLDYMIGATYSGLTSKISPIKLLPLNDPGSLLIQIGNKRFAIYAYGQAGFSVHLPNIPRQQQPKQLILGAPGAYNWNGTTILYNSIASVNFPSRRGNNVSSFTGQPIVIKGDSPRFGLFGYAVTSGKYFSRSEISHAAGAPRAMSVGQVFIYKFPSRTGMTLNSKDIYPVSGNQIGEYFGSTLATCDINGDGLDDLFIGAPLFTLVVDEGRVVIQLGSLTGTFTAHPDIQGSAIRGRFGYAIACLGDMDRDSFQDVAISAPFEDTGVVYLYNGGPKGLSSVTRRIVASEIFPSLRGFGYSIARGQDVDDNGYTDVAIGAYLSGHAVLLRSRPVVQFEVELSTPHTFKLPKNQRDMELQICAKYFGINLPKKLKVIRRLRLDPIFKRVSIDLAPGSTEYESEVMLEAETSYSNYNCDEIQVRIEKNIQNFLEPLMFYAEFDVPKEDPTIVHNIFWEGGPTAKIDDSWTVLPVLRKGKRNDANITVYFESDCNGPCNSQLSINVQFLHTDNSSFVVGSAMSLQLRATVSNSPNSDPAYNTRLMVTLPVRSQQMPPECQSIGNKTERNEVLRCPIGNPLYPNTRRELLFSLEMDGVTAKLGILTVSAQIFTESQDVINNQITEASIALTARADPTISGRANQEMYSYVENEGGKLKFVPFNLTYQVEKFDISPVDEVAFSIFIPIVSALGEGNEIIKLKYNLSMHLMTCNRLPAKLPSYHFQNTTVTTLPVNRTLFVNCSSGNWLCEELQCIAGPFHNNFTVANLYVFLELDMMAIGSHLGRKDNIVITTLANITGIDNYVIQPVINRPDFALVSAIFSGNPPSGHVAAWIVIVSVLAGILLLALIVVALIKAGFFERKERKALTEMREKEIDGGAKNSQNISDEK